MHPETGAYPLTSERFCSHMRSVALALPKVADFLSLPTYFLDDLGTRKCSRNQRTAIVSRFYEWGLNQTALGWKNTDFIRARQKSRNTLKVTLYLSWAAFLNNLNNYFAI